MRVRRRGDHFRRRGSDRFAPTPPVHWSTPPCEQNALRLKPYSLEMRTLTEARSNYHEAHERRREAGQAVDKPRVDADSLDVGQRATEAYLRGGDGSSHASCQHWDGPRVKRRSIRPKQGEGFSK